jgi:hypothetical protein
VDTGPPRHGGALTGAWLPAAPGLVSSPAWVEGGEGRMMIPRRGRWRGGRAMTVKWRRKGSLMEVVLELREREMAAVV